MKMSVKTRFCEDVQGSLQHVHVFSYPSSLVHVVKMLVFPFFYTGCHAAKERRSLGDEKGGISSEKDSHDTRREDRSWR